MLSGKYGFLCDKCSSNTKWCSAISENHNDKFRYCSIANTSLLTSKYNIRYFLDDTEETVNYS